MNTPLFSRLVSKAFLFVLALNLLTAGCNKYQESDIPVIAVDPQELSFPTGTSLTLTISNIGQADLKITNIQILNDDSGAFSYADRTTLTISPEIPDVVSVTYQDIEEEVEATLVITSNDPYTPEFEIPLNNLAKPKTMAIDKTELTFGAIGVDGTFTIINSGAAILKNFVISLSNEDKFEITKVCKFTQAGQCQEVTSFELEKGKSAQVTVKYKADTGSTGDEYIEIQSNATNSPQRVALKVGDFDPAIELSTETLDFRAGATQTLNLQNSGTAVLEIQLTLEGSGFTCASNVCNGSTYNVTVGRSIDITVTYTPPATPANGKLKIGHNATNRSTPIEISLIVQ